MLSFAEQKKYDSDANGNPNLLHFPSHPDKRAEKSARLTRDPFALLSPFAQCNGTGSPSQPRTCKAAILSSVVLILVPQEERSTYRYLPTYYLVAFIHRFRWAKKSLRMTRRPSCAKGSLVRDNKLILSLPNRFRARCFSSHTGVFHVWY